MLILDEIVYFCIPILFYGSLQFIKDISSFIKIVCGTSKKITVGDDDNGQLENQAQEWIYCLLNKLEYITPSSIDYEDIKRNKIYEHMDLSNYHPLKEDHNFTNNSILSKERKTTLHSTPDFSADISQLILKIDYLEKSVQQSQANINNTGVSQTLETVSLHEDQSVTPHASESSNHNVFEEQLRLLTVERELLLQELEWNVEKHQLEMSSILALQLQTAPSQSPQKQPQYEMSSQDGTDSSQDNNERMSSEEVTTAIHNNNYEYTGDEVEKSGENDESSLDSLTDVRTSKSAANEQQQPNFLVRKPDDRQHYDDDAVHMQLLTDLEARHAKALERLEVELQRVASARERLLHDAFTAPLLAASTTTDTPTAPMWVTRSLCSTPTTSTQSTMQQPFTRAGHQDIAKVQVLKPDIVRVTQLDSAVTQLSDTDTPLTDEKEYDDIQVPVPEPLPLHATMSDALIQSLRQQIRRRDMQITALRAEQDKSAVVLSEESFTKDDKDALADQNTDLMSSDDGILITRDMNSLSVGDISVLEEENCAMQPTTRLSSSEVVAETQIDIYAIHVENITETLPSETVDNTSADRVTLIENGPNITELSTQDTIQPHVSSEEAVNTNADINMVTNDAQTDHAQFTVVDVLRGELKARDEEIKLLLLQRQQQQRESAGEMSMSVGDVPPHRQDVRALRVTVPEEAVDQSQDIIVGSSSTTSQRELSVLTPGSPVVLTGMSPGRRAAELERLARDRREEEHRLRSAALLRVHTSDRGTAGGDEEENEGAVMLREELLLAHVRLLAAQRDRENARHEEELAKYREESARLTSVVAALQDELTLTMRTQLTVQPVDSGDRKAVPAAEAEADDVRESLCALTRTHGLTLQQLHAAEEKVADSIREVESRHAAHMLVLAACEEQQRCLETSLETEREAHSELLATAERLNAEVESLKSQCATSSAALVNRDATLLESEELHRVCVAERESALSALTKTEEAHTSLTQTLRETRASLERAESDCSEHRSRVEALHLELDGLREDSAQRVGALNEREELLREARSEQQAFVQQLLSLLGASASTPSMCEDAVQSQIEAQEVVTGDVRERYADVTSLCEELLRTVDTERASRMAAERHIDAVTMELSRYEEQKRILETSLETERESHRELLATAEQLNAEVESLKSQCATSSAALVNRDATLLESEELHRVCVAERESALTALTKAEEAHTSLTQTLEETRTSLERAESECSEHRIRVEALHLELEGLHKESQQRACALNEREELLREARSEQQAFVQQLLSLLGASASTPSMCEDAAPSQSQAQVVDTSYDVRERYADVTSLCEELLRTVDAERASRMAAERHIDAVCEHVSCLESDLLLRARDIELGVSVAALQTELAGVLRAHNNETSEARMEVAVSLAEAQSEHAEEVARLTRSLAERDIQLAKLETRIAAIHATTALTVNAASHATSPSAAGAAQAVHVDHLVEIASYNSSHVEIFDNVQSVADFEDIPAALTTVPLVTTAKLSDPDESTVMQADPAVVVSAEAKEVDSYTTVSSPLLDQTDLSQLDTSADVASINAPTKIVTTSMSLLRVLTGESSMHDGVQAKDVELPTSPQVATSDCDLDIAANSSVTPPVKLLVSSPPRSPVPPLTSSPVSSPILSTDQSPSLSPVSPGPYSLVRSNSGRTCLLPMRVKPSPTRAGSGGSGLRLTRTLDSEDMVSSRGGSPQQARPSALLVAGYVSVDCLEDSSSATSAPLLGSSRGAAIRSLPSDAFAGEMPSEDDAATIDSLVWSDSAKAYVPLMSTRFASPSRQPSADYETAARTFTYDAADNVTVSVPNSPIALEDISCVEGGSRSSPPSSLVRGIVRSNNSKSLLPVRPIARSSSKKTLLDTHDEEDELPPPPPVSPTSSPVGHRPDFGLRISIEPSEDSYADTRALQRSPSVSSRKSSASPPGSPPPGSGSGNGTAGKRVSAADFFASRASQQSPSKARSASPFVVARWSPRSSPQPSPRSSALTAPPATLSRTSPLPSPAGSQRNVISPSPSSGAGVMSPSSSSQVKRRSVFFAEDSEDGGDEVAAVGIGASPSPSLDSATPTTVESLSPLKHNVDTKTLMKGKYVITSDTTAGATMMSVLPANQGGNSSTRTFDSPAMKGRGASPFDSPMNTYLDSEDTTDGEVLFGSPLMKPPQPQQGAGTGQIDIYERSLQEYEEDEANSSSPADNRTTATALDAAPIQEEVGHIKDMTSRVNRELPAKQLFLDLIDARNTLHMDSIMTTTSNSRESSNSDGSSNNTDTEAVHEHPVEWCANNIGGELLVTMADMASQTSSSVSVTSTPYVHIKPRVVTTTSELAADKECNTSMDSSILEAITDGGPQLSSNVALIDTQPSDEHLDQLGSSSETTGIGEVSTVAVPLPEDPVVPTPAQLSLTDEQLRLIELSAQSSLANNAIDQLPIYLKRAQLFPTERRDQPRLKELLGSLKDRRLVVLCDASARMGVGDRVLCQASLVRVLCRNAFVTGSSAKVSIGAWSAQTVWMSAVLGRPKWRTSASSIADDVLATTKLSLQGGSNLDVSLRSAINQFPDATDICVFCRSHASPFDGNKATWNSFCLKYALDRKIHFIAVGVGSDRSELEAMADIAHGCFIFLPTSQ